MIQESFLEKTARLGEEAEQARIRGDAADYVRLCNEIGEPIEDLELCGQGLAEIAYKNKLVEELIKSCESKKSKNYDKYRLLLKAAQRDNVRAVDIYEDTNIKKKHFINIFNYTKLNGPNGKKISILDASEEVIGRAYLGHLLRAKKNYPNL